EPPSTRTHKISLAPVLSATFSRDSCWIIRSTPVVVPVPALGEPGRTDDCLSCAADLPPALLGLLDHADHAPALGRRHRPRLHDLDQVAHADLTGVVVNLDPVGPPHDLAIQRVGHPVLHGDHHGLGHLVADDVATPGLARVALYALGAL